MFIFRTAPLLSAETARESGCFFQKQRVPLQELSVTEVVLQAIPGSYMINPAQTIPTVVLQILRTLTLFSMNQPESILLLSCNRILPPRMPNEPNGFSQK